MDPTCPECRARVADDQRYCLDCGHRLTETRVDWRALLGRPHAAAPAHAAPTLVAGVPLPTPRIAATLLLIVMGFGVIVGGASGPAVPRALAAVRGQLTIVLPPAPKPKPAPAPVEEPVAEPAPTPEPAVVPEPVSTPVVTTPARKPAADKPVISDPVTTPDVPPIHHVFLISLGPGTYDAWFGEQSATPYLAKELAGQGTLLAGYKATAAGELANEIALISGLPATPQTDTNCPTYTTEGCVSNQDVYTLPDQLVALGSTWKAYIEGQDAPGATSASCRHPDDGQADPYAAPREGDPYVTWRNPFVYFQTITVSPDCAADDVGLTALDTDLAKKRTTASFSWIAPSPSNSSPAAAEAWLRVVVPKILASKGYADDGLLAIVPDASGTPDDLTTGALLLSADHVSAGSIDTTAFDHLSMLKGIEELFSLRYLPGVEDKKVKSFVSPLLH